MPKQVKGKINLTEQKAQKDVREAYLKYKEEYEKPSWQKKGDKSAGDLHKNYQAQCYHAVRKLTEEISAQLHLWSEKEETRFSTDCTALKDDALE